MINLQIGFFLSFLGHILILLMITTDFSIFYPKKNTFEIISVGFILEKQEEVPKVLLPCKFQRGMVN